MGSHNFVAFTKLPGNTCIGLSFTVVNDLPFSLPSLVNLTVKTEIERKAVCLSWNEEECVIFILNFNVSLNDLVQAVLNHFVFGKGLSVFPPSLWKR